jgi:hypothetical protein
MGTFCGTLVAFQTNGVSGAKIAAPAVNRCVADAFAIAGAFASRKADIATFAFGGSAWGTSAT